MSENPKDSSKDAEEVLSLQELESDESEVEAHAAGISTVSTSVVGQCGAADV